MSALPGKRMRTALGALLAAALLASCGTASPAASVSLQQRMDSSEPHSMPSPPQTAQSAPQLPASESQTAASGSVSFAYWKAGAFTEGKSEGVYLELYDDQTGLYTADGASVARSVIWHYDGENIVLNFDAKGAEEPYLVSLRAEGENELIMTGENGEVSLRRCTLSGEPVKAEESDAQT